MSNQSQPAAGTSSRLVIDPITRIEGHLKIEVEIVDGVVADAWSSGTLFRGIETILKNRNPEDAWLFTQRLCGVCTYVHGASSVKCVEDAISLNIPGNARIVRNLLMGGQYIHDHIVHFYHLHALDWVDVVSALSADPTATEDLANTLSPNAPLMDFAGTQTKLQNLVNSGQLGPFSQGYWGHQAYTFSPEENLLFTTHYLFALREQVKAAKMHAIFGAKNPHLQSIRVGGITCDHDINPTRINEFKIYLSELRHFVDTIYKPDVVYLANKYAASWSNIGSFNNYLAFGEFPLGDTPEAGLFFPGGVIHNKNLGNVEPVDLGLVSEHVHRSWYEGSLDRHPANGETIPAYTGYNTGSEYSWLKAPRYNGEPMEVGPLARVLIAFANNQSQIVSLVDDFLHDTGLTPGDLHSTLGRVAARMIETKTIADEMSSWVDQLVLSGETYVEPFIPNSASGVGTGEAPRGALGHWINIQNEKIDNYQMVVPSTWNLGPRCNSGKRGPVEESLIGTPVIDPEKPVELLRIIHSFDPCLACAVHVIDRTTGQQYTVTIID